MLKQFKKNVVDAFGDESSNDRGAMVETVLLIAGFAVVAILAVTWIGNAIAGQAHLMATYCISQVNEVTGDTGNVSQATMDKCTGNEVTSLSLQQSKKIMQTNGGRF
jgi:hypothetical protein